MPEPINQDTEQAIRQYFSERDGDIIDSIAKADQFSDSSLFTRHVEIAYEDGTIRNFRILFLGTYNYDRTHQSLRVMEAIEYLPPIQRLESVDELNEEFGL
jgi:hypothetical protein